MQVYVFLHQLYNTLSQWYVFVDLDNDFFITVVHVFLLIKLLIFIS